MGTIRGKSIVIFWHNNKFLFTVCVEESTNNMFYIPVGGGVEFGEHSSEAARREVMEELGEEIENLVLLDTLENIFTYNGIKEHEIVFVYKVDLKNKNAYDSLNANKNDTGKQIKLIWASIDEIKNSEVSIYPFRLLEILEKQRHKKSSPIKSGRM